MAGYQNWTQLPQRPMNPNTRRGNTYYNQSMAPQPQQGFGRPQYQQQPQQGYGAPRFNGGGPPPVQQQQVEYVEERHVPAEVQAIPEGYQITDSSSSNPVCKYARANHYYRFCTSPITQLIVSALPTYTKKTARGQKQDTGPYNPFSGVAPNENVLKRQVRQQQNEARRMYLQQQ